MEDKLGESCHTVANMEEKSNSFMSALCDGAEAIFGIADRKQSENETAIKSMLKEKNRLYAL